MPGIDTCVLVLGYHLYSFCLPTYLPPYFPTSRPPYLPTSLPPSLPTYLPTGRPTCIPGTYLRTCKPACAHTWPLQERTIIQSSDGSRKDKLKKGEESFSVDDYSLFKQDNKLLGSES